MPTMPRMRRMYFMTSPWSGDNGGYGENGFNTEERRNGDARKKWPFDWSAREARRQLRYTKTQIQAADDSPRGLYLRFRASQHAAFGGQSTAVDLRVLRGY